MLSFGMHVGSVPHRLPVTKHSYKFAYPSMVQSSEQLTRHSSPVTLFEHAVASHSALAVRGERHLRGAAEALNSATDGAVMNRPDGMMKDPADGVMQVPEPLL